MEYKSLFFVVFLLLLIPEKNIFATEVEPQLDGIGLSSSNPSDYVVFNPNQLKVTNSRVKRHSYYDDRDRYYPLPIIVGGVVYSPFRPRYFGRYRGYRGSASAAIGFGGGRSFAARGIGGRGIGGPGIGGRGFGGQGIGGRGIGGRGIGGRGIGGRGIGGRGIGGRGGIGGGRGGRG